MEHQRLTSRSPVPVPEQSVFSTRVFSEKKTPHYKPKCPSPPIKTTPMSRVFEQVRTTPMPNSASSHLYKTPDPKASSLFGLSSQHFENLGEIGTGSFGHVYKMQSRIDGKVYAIKRSRHQFRGTKDRERALHEVWFATQLSAHPHVLHYINAWEEQGYLFMQTELCELGCLTDVLENISEPIPEDIIWSYLLDMVLGIQHIHAHNLLHLDIKPANLFLGAGGHLKIGDFGLVHQLGALPYETEGDSRYMALELLGEDETQVSFPADVFCLGATCFEMAANVDMPSNGDTWAELRRGNVARFLPETRSSELRHLIQHMMNPVAAQRPTAEQLLTHWHLRKLLEQRTYAGTSPFTAQPQPSSVVKSSYTFTSSTPNPKSQSPLPFPSSNKHHHIQPPPSARSSPHSISSSMQDIDLPDEDEDVDMLPKNLSLMFMETNERDILRKSMTDLRNSDPIAPRNLLDIFNSTDEK